MKGRIKFIRKSAHMNQTEFGAKIGLKQTSIAAYECGARRPLDTVIASICREFNVREEWLRYGRGDPYLPRGDADILADQLHFSPEQRELLQIIFEQPEEVQDAILNLLKQLKRSFEARAAENAEAAAEKQRKETPEERRKRLADAIATEEEQPEGSVASSITDGSSATG